MSSTESPVFSSACLVARIGPVSIQIGSSPRTDRWCTRARGVSPCCSTARSEAISIAEEASQICDATAAVMRPPSANGLRPAIFSSEVSRGHSSVSKPATGTISFLNRPSSMAVRARVCEARANSSISSRLMSHFSAIISADRNWETSCSPYRPTQPGDSANGVVKPYCCATSMAAEIGMADMFWRPPATTRSWVPDMTPCAAKCTACWEEPHWRSMVTPGTWSGRPATSQAVRATSPAWDPMVSQQPMITSSTAPGSMPVRWTSALSTWAPRSAECIPERDPPRFPTGVRTASTMKASAMWVRPFGG